jgi:hypothetical protein
VLSLDIKEQRTGCLGRIAAILSVKAEDLRLSLMEPGFTSISLLLLLSLKAVVQNMIDEVRA